MDNQVHPVFMWDVITHPCPNLNGSFTKPPFHYDDVIMTTIASQITSLTSVYSTVYSDADQRKHQSSASLAFVWGIHRDRWLPRTKGQLRGKCFHLMTSSCQVRALMNYYIPLLTSVWLIRIALIITVTSQWARWHLHSPALRLFTEPFVQAQMKENIKSSRYWLLWAEFTGERWISRTKDQ